MPIHINLLAEAQAAEELRRRDPVKRAIFIGISLTIVALMWSGMVGVNVLMAEGRLTGVQIDINAKTNAYQLVMSERAKIAAIQTKLAALQNLQTNRFLLQGNLLNALQHTTVTGVQLTSLRVKQSYFLTEGTASQTEGDRVTPGRPATVREKIMMQLDARDFSANPGDLVNKFREAIAQQGYFQRMLDKTNGMQLASPPSAPQVMGGQQFVSFTLDCRFPEVIR
jgi:hypothetical protein